VPLDSIELVAVGVVENCCVNWYWKRLCPLSCHCNYRVDFGEYFGYFVVAAVAGGYLFAGCIDAWHCDSKICDKLAINMRYFFSTSLF
jgi:hypothetical protein